MIRCAGAALVVGLCFAAGPTAAQARGGEESLGFLSRPSLEQQVLRFEREGVRLDIPRNYLIGWWPTRMTQGAPSFMAMAAFPGFEGATRATIHCFDVLGVADVRGCDVVLFIAQQAVGPATVPGRPYWFDYDPDRQPEPAEHGLLRNPKLRDSYVWIGPDSHRTGAVSCPRQLHRCDMVLIASGLRWRVQFPHRLLPQWRAIRDGLTDLLASFQPDRPKHEAAR